MLVSVGAAAFTDLGFRLRSPVNFVNRRPIDASATEAKYDVHAVCDHARVPDVRDLLFETLEAALERSPAIESATWTVSAAA